MERPFLMTMIYLKEFTDLDFFYKGCFHFLRQMPVYLVDYANVCSTVISQPFLARRHLNTMFLPNLENLNSFPNIFQDSRFLSFEGSSNYLYLFKNHRQRFSWLGERPSSYLKFSKIWFGPNIKYLSQPLFVDFFVIEKNIYYDLVIHTYIIRFCYARQHVSRTVWVSAIPFYCHQSVSRLKQNSYMLYTTIIYVFQKIF